MPLRWQSGTMGALGGQFNSFAIPLKDISHGVPPIFAACTARDLPTNPNHSGFHAPRLPQARLFSPPIHSIT